MHITPLKTPKVRVGMQLTALLDAAISSLEEGSVVVVTSKIVSICQGDVMKNDATVDKKALIQQHSEYYLEDDCNEQYGITLTINNHTLIASGGIDESNGDGYLIFWPKNIHEATRRIWKHLRERFHLHNLGVIITDSHTTPLRWGTTGIGISWCGFEALKNYIDTPDIFGRPLHVTKASILDGLAAAAVVTMGEGNEQTPIAVVSDVPFVTFQDRAPTQAEISSLRINITEDIYAPLINSPKWKKGGGS